MRMSHSYDSIYTFKKMLKPTNGGTCILEQIDSTLKPFPAARNEWERLMRTLHEGVIEALRFVESIEVPNNRVFYGHDIAGQYTGLCVKRRSGILDWHVVVS